MKPMHLFPLATTMRSNRSLNSVMPCNRIVLAMMSVLTMSACSFDVDLEEAASHEASAAVTMLSPDACTAVTLATPAHDFTGTAEVPIQLTGAATCPPGQTPEYQYWQKLYGAANWTSLGSHVPGSWTWLPPAEGTGCVPVVARAVGAPEDYQTRSAARCGAIDAGSHPPPIAQDDLLVTSLNTIGAADVLVNDFDTAPFSVTAFTQGLHGTVSIVGAAAIYHPDPDYIGSDSFSYTITDIPFGVSAAAIVNVTVTP